MLPAINKKVLATTTLCLALIGVQSFAQRDNDEQATNLKLLPKNISHDELMKDMHEYSKSLGVHCGYCHEGHEVPGKRPAMDFASDAKPEKQTTREMILMTEAINNQYITKMTDNNLARVTCVTCHNGRKSPIVSVDSLSHSMMTPTMK